MAARVPARLSAGEGRRFGLTVAVAFAGLAGLAWWRAQALVAAPAAALGLALATAALVVPGRLGPVYRFWMGLAVAMSKITAPVLMGVVYFAVLTPIGLWRRLRGKNPLVRPRGSSSFWVPRPAAARRRTDMEHQF